jgi:hypothetical protein
MTFKEMVNADVTDLFINPLELGETVMRYKDGKPSDRTEINAVVTLQETEFETGRGRGYITRGVMAVDDSVTVTVGDAFLIRGAVYQVAQIGPVEFGMKQAAVVRYDTEARGVRTAGDI